MGTLDEEIARHLKEAAESSELTRAKDSAASKRSASIQRYDSAVRVPFAKGPTMVKCPYCNRPAMSLARKAGLGPGRTINCQSCGKLVTTHSMAVFAAIPAFLGGLVALKSGSLLIGGTAIAGGVLAMAFIQTFLVPLVRGDA